MHAGDEVPVYLTAYNNISKALDRIRQAQVPPRFSQDFLETTLDLSGGSARPVIPFLKRTGFLAQTARRQRFTGAFATRRKAVRLPRRHSGSATRLFTK